MSLAAELSTPLGFSERNTHKLACNFPRETKEGGALHISEQITENTLLASYVHPKAPACPLVLSRDPLGAPAAAPLLSGRIPLQPTF